MKGDGLQDVKKVMKSIAIQAELEIEPWVDSWEPTVETQLRSALGDALIENDKVGQTMVRVVTNLNGDSCVPGWQKNRCS